MVLSRNPGKLLVQSANALHVLRGFLQGGSRRPPCTPGGATGTLVLLACTRFMALGWLDSCGAILHPAFAFYGESRALYCATTAASGGISPGTPSLLSSRFVASWVAVCKRFAGRLLPQNSHDFPKTPKNSQKLSRFPTNSHSLPNKRRSVSRHKNCRTRHIMPRCGDIV